MHYVNSDRRERPRYAVSLSVYLYTQDGKLLGDADVTNISSMGISISPFAGLNKSYIINAKIRLTEDCYCYRQIQIVEEGSSGKNLRAIFVDTEQESDKILNSFLSKHELQKTTPNRRTKTYAKKNTVGRNASNDQRVLSHLRQLVSNFEQLAETGARTMVQLQHKTIALIHEICSCLEVCENIALSPSEIKNELSGVRKICARSSFIKRLQDWPRGYCGDFETIDYLVSQQNRSRQDTIEFFLEEYALGSMVAQQHRNKLRFQADQILKRILSPKLTNGNIANLLSVACGSSTDITMISDLIAPFNFKLVLNDIDADAIEQSRKKLAHLTSKCVFLPGNIFSLLKRIKAEGKYDLIIAGGLFDYLTDRQAALLIKRLYSFLRINGSLIFTNIVTDNPYRYWMEYFVDWHLFGRDYDSIANLIRGLDLPNSSLKIRKDQTNLTLFVEISNLSLISKDDSAQIVDGHQLSKR